MNPTDLPRETEISYCGFGHVASAQSDSNQRVFVERDLTTDDRPATR